MDMTIPKIEELNLRKYIDFMKVAGTLKGDGGFGDQLLTFQLLGILLDKSEEEIDAIKLEDMTALSEEMAPLIKELAEFDDTPKKTIEVRGITYVAQDMNSLDNGEYISLNLIKEKWGNSLDILPELLAILVRPGTKEIDPETGLEGWKIETFNKKDIQNLEWRAKLFSEEVPAIHLVPIATFFLTGNERSGKIIQTSSPEQSPKTT